MMDIFDSGIPKYSNVTDIYERLREIFITKKALFWAKCSLT